MCLHVDLLSEYIMRELTGICSLWSLTSLFICCQGNFVHAGNILATQRVIRYHPGAHVSTHSPYDKLSVSCHFLCKSMFSHLRFLSCRWGWEPTRRSLLWRMVMWGSPRRCTSHRPAARRPHRSLLNCQKELCSTRPLSVSCQTNRKASLNWWTWFKPDRTDWTGMSFFCMYSRVRIEKDLVPCTSITCNLKKFATSDLLIFNWYQVVLLVNRYGSNQWISVRLTAWPRKTVFNKCLTVTQEFTVDLYNWLQGKDFQWRFSIITVISNTVVSPLFNINVITV